MKKCREVHLLAVLLITFIIVWAGLVTHIPEVRQPEFKFEDAYKRFTSDGNSRSLLVSKGAVVPPGDDIERKDPPVLPPVPVDRGGQSEENAGLSETKPSDAVANQEQENPGIPDEGEKPKNEEEQPQESESPSPTTAEDAEAIKRRDKVKEVCGYVR